jgi:hypothetical protein
MRVRSKLVLLAALITVASLTAVAQGAQFSAWAAGPYSFDWTSAQKLDEINGNHADVNTPSLDGCPILSPDGLSLYIASDRPGGRGGLDIWVAHRASKSAPFGAPVNLPPPINSASADFCPTPVRGGLYFVTRRATSESCGLADIYFAEEDGAGGWRAPQHLACDPLGPNGSLDEQGPSLLEAPGRIELYFSRSVPVPPGATPVPGDLYVSRLGAGGFGPATPVTELNSAANDIQPNIRRDGLEIVFSSDRAGAPGGPDIWASTRASIGEAWSPPVSLNSNVNTNAGETRPSFSWDARTLLFGRAPGPEGSSDIYVTTREPVRCGVRLVTSPARMRAKQPTTVTVHVMGRGAAAAEPFARQPVILRGPGIAVSVRTNMSGTARVRGVTASRAGRLRATVRAEVMMSGCTASKRILRPIVRAQSAGGRLTGRAAS